MYFNSVISGLTKGKTVEQYNKENQLDKTKTIASYFNKGADSVYHFPV